MKFLFLLLALFSFSQNTIPEKSNAIKVTGITFREIANSTLDAGYILEKVDSNFQTLRTEYKERAGENKRMKVRLMIRVKDSVATITGEWYNALFTEEKYAKKIEYTFGNTKSCFEEMNQFAMTLNRPIEYLVVK